ncbi:MAG: hypothetical protein IJ604_13665 [Prevotella sp.]|nr:hypothetical protein [Prevotella sp.]MBR1464406.1 hypothetical protein [Prevotella sp.]
MKKVFLLVFLLSCLAAHAQRKVKVLDFETELPVTDVSVIIDSVTVRRTNYQGIVELPVPFDSVTFSHLQYYKEKLSQAEVADTMYLMPQHNVLPELVVTGISPDLLRALRRGAEQNRNMPRYSVAFPILTFDFANMLDVRGRRDRKHLKRAREKMREFDNTLK